MHGQPPTPHPSLLPPRDCYLQFLPLYVRGVKLLLFPFFFFATFRIVGTGTELLVVVGHASKRIRPTLPGRVERGVRGAPPLECGPRVLSSTSSSPVSSDTSFGWCSTHESPGVYLFCAIIIIIIVFPFFKLTACILQVGCLHACRIAL